ncbi:MAG TPA: winged helix-turn-helix domain-containing protein [Candidatus Bipolaricaulota bacterium]
MWETWVIGETAGRVWQFLKDNGKSSLSNLERQIDAPNRMVHMAVGWLAREDKVGLTKEKTTVWVWLRE